MGPHPAIQPAGLLEKENAKNIPDLPERIKSDLNLITVSHLEEVLDAALLEAIGAPFTVSNDSGEQSKVKMPPVVKSESSGEAVRAAAAD